MTGWVRVSERLPERRVDVLVYFKSGVMAVTDYADGWWDYEDAYGEGPTHWMPLPERPKIEED